MKQVEIAQRLEDLRVAAGFIKLQDLADAARLSIGTVRRALNAEALPDLRTVQLIGHACHANHRTMNTLRRLWVEARAALRPSWYAPGLRAVSDPLLIGDFPQLIDSMRLLVYDRGSPTTRTLERRAGPGLLSHSSLERTLQGTRIPTRNELIAFVHACGGNAQFVKEWAEAWERADSARRRALSLRDAQWQYRVT